MTSTAFSIPTNAVRVPTSTQEVASLVVLETTVDLTTIFVRTTTGDECAATSCTSHVLPDVSYPDSNLQDRACS